MKCNTPYWVLARPFRIIKSETSLYIIQSIETSPFYIVCNNYPKTSLSHPKIQKPHIGRILEVFFFLYQNHHISRFIKHQIQG